jgi:hypothetical protein
MNERCFLVYALAPEGTSAREANDRLTSFTLESYRGVSLDDLAAAEADDPRFWWRRRSA